MNEHILNTLVDSTGNIVNKMRDLLPQSVISTTGDKALAEKQIEMLLKIKLEKKEA